jgi:pyridoxal phosphate enzyme (YggS family)
MHKVNENYWYKQWHLDFELHQKLGIKNVTQIPKDEPVSIYADTDSLFVSFEPCMQHCQWKNLILRNSQLRLHLIGKLQSNKAKDAFEIFQYIHTLDNEKLAKIFANLENNSLKKIKYFIQVNIANEPQKNGISVEQVNQFIKYCAYDLKLNIIGLMCIPPAEGDPSQYFQKLAEMNKLNNLTDLSMGMSNDYECAIKNGATFVRIGSKIFN